MARLSDIIEDFIKSLLNESDGQLELQRNELADYFECAPSQINYVLATRFSIDRGYYIESRRGGGGYIRIIRLDIDEDDYLMYLLRERIGSRISQQAAEDIIQHMLDKGIIDRRESVIMKSAIQDKAMTALPANIKDSIRANLMKSMLMAILTMRS
ncbi:MAG: CtsR family transcriptional regulator [Clostridiales bacterium]|jgi:transcriptional regulator CtsR|nr:CtsR family transcriptional regulator [Clostridiales bacterium]